MLLPGPKWETAAPPSRPSSSVGTNQEEMPGPVVMACHTSSGEPGVLYLGLDGPTPRGILLHRHDVALPYD